MPLRSTLVGAVSGVVLLAGFVGFAVGLPEVVGDEPEEQSDGDAGKSDVSDGRPVADLLPDELLDGALVRYKDLNDQLGSLFDEVEGYGGEQLSKTFDTDSVVGVYATPDEQVRVAVTIYDGESGLFIQTGPPVPPEMSANSETTGEYVHQGDSVSFGQRQSQAKAQGGPPFQVQCQLVVAGRTINVYEAGGLDVGQTADLADDIARQAGLS
jgi:hypothetical protein